MKCTAYFIYYSLPHFTVAHSFACYKDKGAVAAEETKNYYYYYYLPAGILRHVQQPLHCLRWETRPDIVEYLTCMCTYSKCIQINDDRYRGGGGRKRWQGGEESNCRSTVNNNIIYTMSMGILLLGKKIVNAPKSSWVSLWRWLKLLCISICTL